MRFSIDFWVRFTDVTLAETHLVGQRGTLAGYYWEISYRYSAGQGTLIARIQENSLNEVDINVNWSPANAIWYHITFVRNGSTFTAYVDGASIATDTWAGTATDISSLLLIG